MAGDDDVKFISPTAQHCTIHTKNSQNMFFGSKFILTEKQNYVSTFYCAIDTKQTQTIHQNMNKILGNKNRLVVLSHH
jgi:hypothetical protein